MKSISFIAIPSFQIAAERALSRRLRERPLAVAAGGGARSRLIEVSAEARRRGVRRGMTASDGRRACRDLCLLPPNPSLCQRAQTAISGIISQFTPVAEPVRPGQFFLDLSGTTRLFGGPTAVAGILQRRFETELRLSAEAGVAINKLVSRVAAIEASPDKLLTVDQGCEEPFLAPKHPALLPAADRPVRERFKELNVNSVGQIRSIDLDLLVAGFGPVGYLLARQSRGIDPERVTPPEMAPSVIVKEDLAEDSNDPDLLRAVSKFLIIEAVIKLGRVNLGASQLTFRAFYSDGLIAEGRRSAPLPSRSLTYWEKQSSDMFTSTVKRRIRVKRIELLFEKLGCAVEQTSLPSLAGSCDNGREAILAALDSVRSRFGDGAISWGSRPSAKGF